MVNRDEDTKFAIPPINGGMGDITSKFKDLQKKAVEKVQEEQKKLEARVNEELRNQLREETKTSEGKLLYAAHSIDPKNWELVYGTLKQNCAMLSKSLRPGEWLMIEDYGVGRIVRPDVEKKGFFKEDIPYSFLAMGILAKENPLRINKLENAENVLKVEFKIFFQDEGYLIKNLADIDGQKRYAWSMTRDSKVGDFGLGKSGPYWGFSPELLFRLENRNGSAEYVPKGSELRSLRLHFGSSEFRRRNLPADARSLKEMKTYFIK